MSAEKRFLGQEFSSLQVRESLGFAVFVLVLRVGDCRHKGHPSLSVGSCELDKQICQGISTAPNNKENWEAVGGCSNAKAKVGS